MGIEYNSIPLGSVVTVPQAEGEQYVAGLFELPQTARKFMVSTRTGAFVRGLTKAYRLEQIKAPIIALSILKIGIGKIPLSGLGAHLSGQLRLPNDKAQKMAREIEQDLFGPVRQELEAYWAKDKKEKPAAQAQAKAEESGVNNVLNLKKESQPPVPPWRKQ